MSRALVLAGGGMRVGWQTGVVTALTEHGLSFDHIDGTSGGIMTAGMLLSGQSPEQMCARWSALDITDFTSPLPLRDYLRGPWAMPGLGDADGVIGKVFPALGIDCAAIRNSTVQGTFSLVDFVTKTCVAVPHSEVDEELLAAGMSLPLVMPPLRRGDRVWTDAVWVKDANVTEALRRGADEVWLVWCIGNSPYWGDGPLEQYVHMIEMSASGALFAELDAATAAGRRFTLHVVRPEHPLPLDSELFAGRIDVEALMAMGYRDTWAYLDSLSDAGVAKDANCTAMTEPAPGVRLHERLRGRLDEAELVLDLDVEIAVPDSGALRPGRVSGWLTHGPWGGRRMLAGGRLEATGQSLTYRARARVGTKWVNIEARRELADDDGLDAWADATTVVFTASTGQRGTLRLGPLDAARALASAEPVGAHGVTERARVLAGLGRGGLRGMRATYST